jgi:AcrR family transcriptional regulator
MVNSETGLPEQILQTANTLFVNEGYHGLSMREIAAALGVSKAALYYYFKDKEELFLAILRLYLEDIDAALNHILVQPVACKEQIRLFVEYVLTQPAQQRATIRLAMQESIHLSPEARLAFGITYREKFIDKVQSILQAGMQNHEFRQIDPEVAVWALLGIMFPYFYPAHGGNQPIPEEIIREVVKIYLAGISS